VGVDYDRLERIPMDPRVVEEIQKSPTMRAEQGPGFMSYAGGPAQYRLLAGLPREERLVYAAVAEGYSLPSEIEVVTGLTGKQVSRGVEGLKKMGLISLESV
jgi:hypothetical protein